MICARDAVGLCRAVDGLRAAGAEVTATVCDITSTDAPARLIETALTAYGQLDMVVNNAGMIQVGPVENVAFDDIESAMAVMALAPARLALAATTTCPNGSLTAPGGATSVQMTGDPSQGMTSCTVSVPVTSPAVGTFTNGRATSSRSAG